MLRNLNGLFEKSWKYKAICDRDLSDISKKDWALIIIIKPKFVTSVLRIQQIMVLATQNVKSLTWIVDKIIKRLLKMVHALTALMNLNCLQFWTFALNVQMDYIPINSQNPSARNISWILTLFRKQLTLP